MTNKSAESYDAVVIGSGEGGKYLAWHLASKGQRTAVVERRWIGGSCPNINCLPSKNEIWSARVAHMVARAGDYGITTGPVTLDMAKVVDRKRRMVEDLITFHLEKYKASGAELIMGSARIVKPQTVEVILNDGGVQTLSAKKLFLNVGTRPSIPQVPGLIEAKPMTNIEILELDHLPNQLIVIGGGYVGLELAQAYRRFGSKVTIIERSERLIKREDPDVSETVQAALEADGVQFIFSGDVTRVTGSSGSEVVVYVKTPSGEITIEGSHLLVAAGRTPNTNNMGLEETGIQLTNRGYIKVDERLQTTAPETWAIGECAGSPQFTHISLDDFRVIRDNLDGKDRTTTSRLVPYCMFIDPPFARVGSNEIEARESGANVRVAKLPMKSVLKTRTTLENAGFMKAIIGADDQILGFMMIGSEAGEVMSLVQTAILGRLPYTALRDGILAHPTVSEGLNTLFGSLK